MLPPKTKSLIIAAVEKYASELKRFKNSNPVIMLGELKLDRIDQKIIKEATKLNSRQVSKDAKIEGKSKKYENRKAAITYRSYTVQFKRKLIQRIKELNEESNSGLSKIIRAKARQLNIHPKNIFRWFHTKEIKKKEGGRKALYPQMEERLAQFIINNPKMKRKHILRQAKQIMEDLKIPGREYFNFSKGWYERFRERLVRRKILPGKIEVKKEFESQNDDSDFDDDSLDSVKKEEYLCKDEANEVKFEYGNDESDSFESEQEKQQKTQVKKTDESNSLVIFYEQIIDDVNEKVEQKKELNDTNVVKKYLDDSVEEKKEAQTDESSEKCYGFEICDEKEANVSIFVSEEQS